MKLTKPIVASALAGLLWAPAGSTGADTGAATCVRPRFVQRLVFSAQRYPNVRRHSEEPSGAAGHGASCSTGAALTIAANDCCTTSRRARASTATSTPPAVGRGRGPGLERGRNPRGWKADVRYVPSGENRSHGASLGNQLSDFCNGTRFRYVFR